MKKHTSAIEDPYYKDLVVEAVEGWRSTKLVKLNQGAGEIKELSSDLKNNIKKWFSDNKLIYPDLRNLIVGHGYLTFELNCSYGTVSLNTIEQIRKKMFDDVQLSNLYKFDPRIDIRTHSLLLIFEYA